MRHHSSEASLVALSLPAETVEEATNAPDGSAYLRLLEKLTLGLDRYLFIRGGGSEVVTIFN